MGAPCWGQACRSVPDGGGRDPAAPRQAWLFSVRSAVLILGPERLRPQGFAHSVLVPGPSPLHLAPAGGSMGDALGRRWPLRAAPPAAVFPAWLLCRGTVDPGKEGGATPPAAPGPPDAGRAGRPSPLRLLGRHERGAHAASRQSLRAAVQRRVPARPSGLSRTRLSRPSSPRHRGDG